MNIFKSKYSGFTIIELIIVMVIIGLLAILTLPRLFDLSGQARKNVLISICSSLQTSAELIYSQWVASGQPHFIELGEEKFYTAAIGYPLNTGNVVIFPMTIEECLNLWNKLLKNPPLALSSYTHYNCRIDGECKFEVSLSGDNNEICTFIDKDNNYITYNTSTGIIDNSIGIFF